MEAYLAVVFAVSVVNAPQITRAGGGCLAADLEERRDGIALEQVLGRRRSGAATASASAAAIFVRLEARKHADTRHKTRLSPSNRHPVSTEQRIFNFFIVILNSFESQLLIRSLQF